MNRFPDGKRFAFSVFDDTDGGTTANLRPVYQLLDELGIFVTKSVWPLATITYWRVKAALEKLIAKLPRPIHI